ncbi:MAG: hypothetical protein ABIK62_01710, partial [candidate division WOR-3 bacterium]
MTALLRSLDPKATITDSVKTLGTLPPGESACVGGDGFGFRIAGDCPDGYELKFQLICRDANDSSWSSEFKAVVGAPVMSYFGKRVNDPPPGGNGNGRLDPGESAELFLVLANQGGGHAYDLQATLISTDPRLQITDPTGRYVKIPRGQTGENTENPFSVTVATGVVPGTEFPCTLKLTGPYDYSAVLLIRIPVGEIMAFDPIHDNRSPALYWSIDDYDANYTGHPEYDWIEIAGRGYRLSLGDDQTEAVSLPSAFGPFRYYGQAFNRLSVCSNGWVAAGITTSTIGANTELPNAILPAPAICANWDDLNPAQGGSIWVLHDPSLHAYIIEWDSVAYKDTRLGADKFQVIIYDTTVRTASGNNVILVQYMTANG